MAESKKITDKDVIQDDLFKNTRQSAEKTLQVLDSLELGLKEILKVQTQILSKSGRVLTNPEELKKANDELEKNKKINDSISQVRLQRIRQEEVLKRLRSDEIQQNEEIAILTKEQRRINRELAKESLNLVSAFDKGRQAAAKMKKELKDLKFQGKENTDQYRKLKTEFESLDKRVRDASETFGDFQHNVGNYKNDIKEAIADTAGFNGALFEGVRAFRNYRRAMKETGEEQGKFNTILKATGIGFAVLVVAALKKLADQFIEVSQEAQDAAFLLGKGINLAITNKAAREFIVTLQGTRKELRALSKDLQDVNNEASDLAAIAADETISIGMRNAALDASIKLDKQRADIEIKIAQANLKNAQAEVNMAGSKIGNAKVVNDLLVKQQEAENALSAALDKRQDLEIEGQRRQRKLQQEQITNNIELTRSQRLTANARQKELEAQLKDEKTQLEERFKIAKELNQININSTKAQAKELEKAGVSREIFNELVATSDEVQLKNIVRKKLANIEGTIIEKELFKVVKEAQENRIKNDETIKKLQDEELKRQNRLLEIQTEIQRMKREDEIEDLTNNLEFEKEVVDKLEDEISSKVFNVKLQKKRKDFLKQIEEDEKRLFESRENNLRKNAEAQIENINRTITDEKLKAEEIKKIQEQLNIDLENLETERARKQAEQAKESLKFQNEIAKEQLKIVSQTVQKSLDIAENQIDKEQEEKENAIEREIEKRDEAIDRQADLAARGLENQLAFEQQKKAEAELRQKQLEEEEAKRKEALLLAEAYLQAFISELEQPNSNPATAAAKALADVLLAQALGKTIAGAFKDGVEKLEGPGTTTSDSILIRASKGEGVANAAGVAENPGLVTAMNKKRMRDYTQNVLIPKYQLDTHSATQKTTTKVNDDYIANSMLLTEISKINDTLAELPVQNFRFDHFGNFIESIWKKGVMKHIKHVPPKL